MAKEVVLDLSKTPDWLRERRRKMRERRAHAAGLIKAYGEMWAKNEKNIEAVLGSKEGGLGVYILYDGSFPVYVGKGKIRQRVRDAYESSHRGQLWDHFTWYALEDPGNSHDIEALLLRLLPYYLRILNRQRGKFKGGGRKKHDQVVNKPEPILRAKLIRSFFRRKRVKR